MTSESGTTDSEITGVSTPGIEVAGEKIDWIEKAIEYEATPKALREPIKKGDFIKSLGIPESTYRWTMRQKENKRRIVEIWLNEALNGGNEVLAKLAEKAKDGDMKAIELYMKFVLELAENLDIKSDGRAVIINQVFYDRNNDSTQISTEDIPITISPSISEPEV